VAVVGGIVFAVPFAEPVLPDGHGDALSHRAGWPVHQRGHKSQFLATQLAMITTFLPATLLSGLMFDLSSMPRSSRSFRSRCRRGTSSPPRAASSSRAWGSIVLWGQALGMILFAVVGLGLAVHAFKKEIA